MKNQKLLVLLLIMLLSVVPQLAVAQYGGYGYNIGGYDILKIIFGPEVDPLWYQPYYTLQYLVFPFIALWMIIYGVMSEIRIFRHKENIQAVLALVMGLIASSTGILVNMTRLLSQFLGFWSLAVFGAVFIGGAYFWARGTIGMHKGASSLYEKYESELKDIENKIKGDEAAWSTLMTSGDVKRAAQVRRRIDQLYARKRDVQNAYHDYL